MLRRLWAPSSPMETASASSCSNADAIDRASIRLPVVQLDRRHVSQEEKCVRPEVLRQQRGRGVLVDDGFDALELAVRGSADRHTSASGTDDDGTVGQQDLDGRQLDYLLWFG